MPSVAGTLLLLAAALPAAVAGGALGFGTDFDGRMCSTEIGGCIDVVTNPAFWQLATDSYPYVGAIKISDGRGAFVQLAATSGTGSVDVTYDLDGPGVLPTVGPISTTWSCLEAEADSSVCLQ